MPDRDAIYQSTLVVVAEIADMSADEIQATDKLRDDLGLDSLQEMEIMSRLSEEYDIEPEMKDVMNVRTVADVADFLVTYLKD